MLTITEHSCRQQLRRRDQSLPTSTMNANSQHDARYLLMSSMSWYDDTHLYLLYLCLRLSDVCAIIVPFAPKQI